MTNQQQELEKIEIATSIKMNTTRLQRNCSAAAGSRTRTLRARQVLFRHALRRRVLLRRECCRCDFEAGSSPCGTAPGGGVEGDAEQPYILVPALARWRCTTQDPQLRGRQPSERRRGPAGDELKEGASGAVLPIR